MEDLKRKAKLIHQLVSEITQIEQIIELTKYRTVKYETGETAKYGKPGFDGAVSLEVGPRRFYLVKPELLDAKQHASALALEEVIVIKFVKFYEDVLNQKKNQLENMLR